MSDTQDREELKREGVRRVPRFEIKNRMRVVAVPLHPRDPPAGSVDLRSLRYSPDAAEDWGKGMRIQDCVTTTNAAFDDLVELIAESLAYHLDELQDALEKKIDDLQLEGARDRAALAELRAQVAELPLALERSTNAPKTSPARRRPAVGTGSEVRP